jgi:hypothetical protein
MPTWRLMDRAVHFCLFNGAVAVLHLGQPLPNNSFKPTPLRGAA